MHLVTHYNFDVLQDFFRFIVLRTRTSKKKLPFLIACSVIVIAGAVVTALTGRLSSTLVPVFVVLVACVLLIDFLVAYLWFFNTERTQKKNPTLFSVVNEYDFEGKFFTVKTQNDSASKTETVRYDDLLKIVETPRYFYLFMTPSSAYIVAKSELYQAEGEKLKHMLSGKCKDKYYFRKH